MAIILFVRSERRFKSLGLHQSAAINNHPDYSGTLPRNLNTSVPDPIATFPTHTKEIKIVVWLRKTNQTEFMSEMLQETVRIFGLTQLQTSGSHPQKNGLVKSPIRTLKQMLCKIVTREGRLEQTVRWDLYCCIQKSTSFIYR